MEEVVFWLGLVGMLVVGIVLFRDFHHNYPH